MWTLTLVWYCVLFFKTAFVGRSDKKNGGRIITSVGYPNTVPSAGSNETGQHPEGSTILLPDLVELSLYDLHLDDLVFCHNGSALLNYTSRCVGTPW
eukprot:scaffold1794_cov130-Amphora_coffeaeformis.AAC.1